MEQSERFHLRLDEETKTKLKEMAEKMDLSMAEVVRTLVEWHSWSIKRHEIP